MIIYVITEGEYSDYHICGVATEKEKAEEIKQLNTDSWHEANIEVYDTDDYYVEKGRFYNVIMYDSNVSVSELTFPVNVDQRNKVLESWHKIPRYHVFVKAMDEEHAKKIGIDLINQFKAEKEGLT